MAPYGALLSYNSNILRNAGIHIARVSSQCTSSNVLPATPRAGAGVSMIRKDDRQIVRRVEFVEDQSVQINGGDTHKGTHPGNR